MNKAKTAVLAAALCMTFLAGCGSMEVPAERPANTPYVTDDLVNDTLPDMDDMMPDTQDGVVGDTDGIIDEGDTGTGSVKENIQQDENNVRNAIRGMQDHG